MSMRRAILAALIGVFAAAASARADVVINEIMYNSIESPDVEYVEIYNNGATAVDLSGWYLLDSDPLHGKCYLVGELQPGAYLVVAGFISTFQAKYRV